MSLRPHTEGYTALTFRPHAIPIMREAMDEWPGATAATSCCPASFFSGREVGISLDGRPGGLQTPMATTPSTGFLYRDINIVRGLIASASRA